MVIRRARVDPRQLGLFSPRPAAPAPPPKAVALLPAVPRSDKVLMRLPGSYYYVLAPRPVCGPDDMLISRWTGYPGLDAREGIRYQSRLSIDIGGMIDYSGEPWCTTCIRRLFDARGVRLWLPETFDGQPMPAERFVCTGGGCGCAFRAHRDEYPPRHELP